MQGASPEAFLKLHWLALPEQLCRKMCSAPSQSGLLHLLKRCEGLSSLLMYPGSPSCWNTTLRSSITQPHASSDPRKQYSSGVCSAMLPFHPGKQSRMLKSIIQLHWNQLMQNEQCATLKTAQPLKSDCNQDTTTPRYQITTQVTLKANF